jgi:hypothetical protein
METDTREDIDKWRQFCHKRLTLVEMPIDDDDDDDNPSYWEYK